MGHVQLYDITDIPRNPYVKYMTSNNSRVYEFYNHMYHFHIGLILV